MRDRVLTAVQSRHSSYFKSYVSERRLEQEGVSFDPIDLALYVCNRLQLDNEWITEKLSKLDTLKCGKCECLMDEIDELRQA